MSYSRGAGELVEDESETDDADEERDDEMGKLRPFEPISPLLLAELEKRSMAVKSGVVDAE